MNPRDSRAFDSYTDGGRTYSVKSNGADTPSPATWDARLTQIERRLAEIADSGEQR